MNLAIAGWPIVGAVQLNESLLDVITRRLRTGFRKFMEALNQKGNPL